MNELKRRLLFLLLFAVVFYHTGAHISQAFVNYPAWKYIGIDTFPAYHRVMAPRAGLWILLPRLLELILATAVLRYRPTPLKRGALVLAIALALCALLSTIFIQYPIHQQLESVGNTPELLARLRATNWLRLTPEWLRAALYLWMMSLLVRPQPQDRAKTQTYSDTA